MPPQITVEHVSKRYSRNASAHLGYGLRDLLRVVAGRRPSADLRQDEFLAVNNVSFEVEKGDSIALIGRNGSGKTTLLKMMSGLIRPDAGTIVVDGRIQALINLGAGFNNALSGRENILNSAALMGLGNRATRDILDETIAFAELEEFIDSPVGTYSSGMRARLGFSVAVHLDPDILFVDEILAVGDYAFQNRCFARMQQLKKRGVTIVLVSHAHNSVIQLCERAIWLHQGVCRQVGDAGETVKAYLSFLERLEADSVTLREEKRRAETHKPDKPTPKPNADPNDGLYGPIHPAFDRIEALEFHFESRGQVVDSVRMHDDLSLRYRFQLASPVHDLNITLKLFRRDGLHLSTISTLNGDLLKPVHTGEVDAGVVIPDFDFTPGTYVLVMAIHEGKSYLWRDVVKEFTVVGDGNFSWGLRDFRYRYSVAGETVYDTTAPASNGEAP